MIWNTSCATIQRSINKALVTAHLTSGPHKVDLWLSLHSQTHLAYFYVAHKKQQMIATFEPNIYYYYYYLFLLKHLDWCLLSLLNLFRGRLLVCEIITPAVVSNLRFACICKPRQLTSAQELNKLPDASTRAIFASLTWHNGFWFDWHLCARKSIPVKVSLLSHTTSAFCR